MKSSFRHPIFPLMSRSARTGRSNRKGLGRKSPLIAISFVTQRRSALQKPAVRTPRRERLERAQPYRCCAAHECRLRTYVVEICRVFAATCCFDRHRKTSPCTPSLSIGAKRRNLSNQRCARSTGKSAMKFFKFLIDRRSRAMSGFPRTR